jgi:hypothetical protein
MKHPRLLKCLSELRCIQHHWNCDGHLGNRARNDVARQEMKLDPKISEADFKDMVISVAKRYGWLVHHDLPAQNSRGRWMTNVQGDAGFPDLFMVHPFQGGRPLVIELKAEKGKLTPGQKIWLNACEMAGCHAAVWKPSDIEYILYTLSNPRA